MTCSSIIRGMSCLIALVVWFHASSEVVLPAETEPRQLFHLTARPWRPLGTQRERYLDVIEGLCRFSIRHQNDQGAIIDPFLHREHQYATPYFAYAVGTLIAEGKATDLSSHGILAIEHATGCFDGGAAAIPDRHGEFFIAALTGALPLYQNRTPTAQWERWRERLKKPQEAVVQGGKNNWETYLLKGEWMRVKAGLANREAAVAIIEDAWTERQRKRIAAAPFFLYHDRTSVPDTLSVEAVGRGNLLALIHLGYDGPSAGEIRYIAETATRMSLLLQDPSGQAPTNGRTDDHVWVDIGYQLSFEVMAERMLASDPWLAGQYRRAAVLAFQNYLRWQRSDGEWAGSFFVTKNHFDPELRVGHQTASQYSNYNGSLMFHLAEAFHARHSTIVERPAPAEVGGFAIRLDDEFSTAFANAGGMQVQANLRGETSEGYGNFWTPLGIVRMSRSGWDTRLGPSDGALTRDGGVSFAPTFAEDGRWFRMADLSERYEASWDVALASPVLVRVSISYAPRAKRTGPTFRQDLVITPDGLLSTVVKTSTDDSKWGVTWPILENDGHPLQTKIDPRSASTSYASDSDVQTFFAINDDAEAIPEMQSLRSTYGDLRPVRVVTSAPANHTFVYPHTSSDPEIAKMHESITVTEIGYRSLLGRVDGNLYVGRTAAGGMGSRIDLDNDGKTDVSFSSPCVFILQLHHGKVTAVETDSDVTMTQTETETETEGIAIKAFTPLSLSR